MDEVLNETGSTLVENATNNATAKFSASPEGLFLAYSSLVIMALIPIWIGSFKSVKLHKSQKLSGDTPETMTSKDAAMFPIIASCALFGIYMLFQIFSKEHINLLLTFYFFGLGAFAMSHILNPFIRRIIPDNIPYFGNVSHHILYTQGEGDNKEVIMDYKFDNKDVIGLSLCILFGVWYLVKKHWIANNVIGFSFCVNGVEFLQLNSVVTGCILLGGLFVYDIFWVFGTDVMVTVAKSFDAPIKLVFPQDLLENGLAGKHFAMLGLGDIVIPGIFLALLLRFDNSRRQGSVTYFYAGYAAYISGLLTTILVMHYFKHAQPALLYLVPFCIGFPLALAVIKGDLKAMFAYEDNPEKKDEGTDESKNKNE